MLDQVVCESGIKAYANFIFLIVFIIIGYVVILGI